MIRFTWLQFRAQAVVVAGALALLAIAAAGLLHRDDGTVRLWLGVLVLVAPGLIGMFWGAPLVAREFEEGTFRLAWTQSVTRTRWMAVKLAVVGLASMAAAGLLSLVVTWWSGPLDRADLNQFATFDQRGIVPVWLRRVRVHPRRAGRGADPAHAPGHVRHACRLRRGPADRVQLAAAAAAAARCC